MGFVIANPLENKVDTWEAWIEECNGARSAGIKDMNQRHSLTRHAAWLAETPMGATVAVLQEGSGSDSFMNMLGKSTNEFDK